MLKVTNLVAGYGKVQVLHGISLEVRPGTLVTLIGSNGAGKTTTLRTLSGMIKPSAGSILLGRALAPVEQEIGGWQLVIRARQSWGNLQKLLETMPEENEVTALPRRRGRVDVQQLTVVPPEHQ